MMKVKFMKFYFFEFLNYLKFFFLNKYKNINDFSLGEKILLNLFKNWRHIWYFF